ncbi:MAG: beta-ketoacyl-ACP synthase, partial [Treponema sp.]|nr:beta-ketoacyl-ACP synthase [Treponema sp.]
MNFTKPNGKRRVVITGGSMISALGRDWETAYANLKAGKNKIRYMPEWERFTKMNTRLACPYDGELPSFPRKKVRGMGRVALLSLVTASEALKDAGFLTEDGSDVIEELKNGRTGIAYGTCMGSMDAIGDLAEMMRTGDSSHLNSQTYIKAMPQTNACNLSVYYQIR